MRESQVSYGAVSPRGVIGSGSLRRLLDTIDVFRKAKESGQFFARRYGYAVLPTIGIGGIVVGGAHGTGRLHVKSQHARSASMTQPTVGWQLGGRPAAKSSSSKTSGRSTNLAAAPSDSAPRSCTVAITAGASAQVVTGGSSASASDTQRHSKNGAKYYNRKAVSTVA